MSVCLFVCAVASSETFAQRKAVSAAEVTGTFDLVERGKNRASNEILIQALGSNRLKIEMNLMYFFENALGPNVHFGAAAGEAVIEGDTAVFVPEEATDRELCKITLKFSKPGTLVALGSNIVGIFDGSALEPVSET